MKKHSAVSRQRSAFRNPQSEIRNPKLKKGLIYGITGGFGTGKSTVRTLFRRMGCAVLDADAIYHDLIRPGRAGWKRLVKAFGKDILRSDRTIDRAALSKIVFARPAARKRLERLTHPLVRSEIDRRVADLRRRFPGKPIAVEIPLLVEAKAFRHVDVVVLVETSRTVQLARLKMKFPKAAPRALAAVVANQMPLAKKRRYADWIVVNNESRSKTAAQVLEILAGEEAKG